MNTTHEVLKNGTQEQHKLIEKHLGLLDREPTLDFYSRLLEKYAAFYETLESAMGTSAHVPESLQLQRRLKTEWIKKDLQHLNRVPPMAAVAVPMDFSSRAEVLGVMYVLEGSTLGGQVILRHFMKHLPITSEKGGAFFNSYGPDTGKMWRDFLAVLNAEVVTEEEKQKALQAAQETFISLRAWI